ncbi:MAG: hypothetical protein IJQ73_02395 [Kiritimatiellae bacterium]|nr:hypothetical protein [Kiritimatiellia bacterium]
MKKKAFLVECVAALAAVAASAAIIPTSCSIRDAVRHKGALAICKT